MKAVRKGNVWMFNSIRVTFAFQKIIYVFYARVFMSCHCRICIYMSFFFRKWVKAERVFCSHQKLKFILCFFFFVSIVVIVLVVLVYFNNFLFVFVLVFVYSWIQNGFVRSIKHWLHCVLRKISNKNLHVVLFCCWTKTSFYTLLNVSHPQ